MTLLDLQAVTQRQATWRFDLVDHSLIKTGEIDVDMTSPPTLTVDVSRALKRTLTNLTLPLGVVDSLDVVHEKFRVVMITDDGLEWPQGVFHFTDVSKLVVSSGILETIGVLNCVDESLIVDQQTRYSTSVAPGAVITDAIMDIMSTLPCVHNIQPSGAITSPDAEALAWPAGTSRLRIINELAAMIGYHELYFDNTGVGQLGPMPNPDVAVESEVISYPVGVRTYRGAITRSTNILELPNVFVVINSGVTNSPVYGEYEVPDDAPHSIMHRGFEVPHVESIQGISTSADAAAAAQALARQWQFPHETVEFSGPPDPRHDHYDIIDFEGIRFLELRWAMPLREGAPMTHSIRRTYEAT